MYTGAWKLWLEMVVNHNLIYEHKYFDGLDWIGLDGWISGRGNV